MALRIRGNSYVSEKRKNGDHHRVTIGKIGEISKTRAKEIDQQMVVDFVAGRLEKTSEVTFDEAAQQYLESFAESVESREALGLNGRSSKTLKTYRGNFKALKKFFSGKLLSEISLFTLRSYRVTRKDFPISYNRELSFLSAIFNHAKMEGKLKGVDNPVQGQKLKFQETKRTRSLTEEESSRFFSELADHAFLPFAIEHYCGLRLQSQVLKLKHDDLKILIDATTGEKVGSLEAQAVYSKNKRQSSVPVPPWLLDRLEAHIEKSDPEVNKEGWLFTHGNGKRRKGMISAFQGACRRVQEKYGEHLLQDFHIHDIRHTWASWSHAHGADQILLMKMGNWSSLEMVSRYTHPADEKARQITNSLPAPGRITEKERTDQRTTGNLQDSELLEVVSNQ